MATRYQRGNQKPYIKEVQAIQWPKDTKEVIRSRTSKKYRQYNGQKITKGVIRSRIDLRLLITPLVSFGHCIACTSLIYGFWLPLWYLLAIVLSILLWFTASDYPFGIFWPLYCLYFFDLRLLITPLVSFGHCIACTSLIYSFWLPLWYLVAIKEVQAIQWPKDTKGVIRSRKSKRYRQYNGHKIPKR
jgi:hypothetical protein